MRFRVGRKRSVPGEKGLSGVSNASLGFYTVWFVHLGRRYGIISYLSRRKRPAGARAIARACELHEPAVRVWCESARSLGIIDREGDGYRMPPISRALFADADDVRFLGGQFSYLALRSLDFEAFDALFRRGARALDVGCGTGGWALRMAREFPKSSFLGIDPDRTAIRIARNKRRIGGGRVRFRVGSGGERIREPAPFDLAYLGEVLYHVKDKLRLLRNVRNALARDGVLVLAEGLVTPARNSADPVPNLVGAMGLDFALQGARFFERSELEALLREAGFSRVKFHDAGGGLWFVVAVPRLMERVLERGGAARRARGDR